MQAPLPWTEERCIALRRVMHDLFNVQVVLGKEQSILSKVMQPASAMLVSHLTVALQLSINNLWPPVITHGRMSITYGQYQA